MASRRFLRCRCNRPEFPPSQFFPRGKTGPAHSFPREKTDWSDFSPPSQFFPPLYFFRICNSKYPLCGKLGHSFCHWDQNKNDVLLLIIGVGKNWAGPFFPHLEKWKHQPCADGYLGGEKLGRPILSPPWLVKTSPIPCHEYANNLCILGGGEKLGRPILSPPRQDKTAIWCRWLSGWRKTWLICFFPTLTGESINLTLSWICKQPLLIRGWGKTGPAHSFPTPTRQSINLVQMVILLEKNSAAQLFSHPDKWKHQPYPVMNTHTTFAY